MLNERLEDVQYRQDIHRVRRSCVAKGANTARMSASGQYSSANNTPQCCHGREHGDYGCAKLSAVPLLQQQQYLHGHLMNGGEGVAEGDGDSAMRVRRSTDLYWSGPSARDRRLA